MKVKTLHALSTQVHTLEDQALTLFLRLNQQIQVINWSKK